MIIVGVDPGFSNFGVSAVEYSGHASPMKIRCLYADVFRTKKQKVEGRPERDFERRALIISGEFHRVLKEYKPDVLAMERLSPVRNSVTMTQLGMAWGLCLGLAYGLRIPVFGFGPKEIKVAACRNHRASKKQVITRVKAIFPKFNSWPKGGKCEHAADSVGAILAFLSSPYLKEVQEDGR